MFLRDFGQAFTSKSQSSGPLSPITRHLSLRSHVVHVFLQISIQVLYQVHASSHWWFLRWDPVFPKTLATKVDPAELPDFSGRLHWMLPSTCHCICFSSFAWKDWFQNHAVATRWKCWSCLWHQTPWLKICLARMFDSGGRFFPELFYFRLETCKSACKAAARTFVVAPVLQDQTCIAPLLNEGRQSFKKKIFFCIKVYQPIPSPLCNQSNLVGPHLSFLAVRRCPETCWVPFSMSRYSMVFHPRVHTRRNGRNFHASIRSHRFGFVSDGFHMVHGVWLKPFEASKGVQAQMIRRLKKPCINQENAMKKQCRWKR